MHAFTPLFLAALAVAAPATPAVSSQSTSPNAIFERVNYVSYNGDGSVGAGWPPMTSWRSFDDMWNINAPVMKQTCGWNGGHQENTQDEINAIRDACVQVGRESGVDSRLILAVIMQESKGCVRAVTTYNPIRNPGLMQTHNGAGTCEGRYPCPRDMIFQMVRDGTQGTRDGDGLKQTLAWSRQALGGQNIARAFYAAARKYNSGSVDWSNLNNAFSSTFSYARDIANRFQGWVY